MKNQQKVIVYRVYNKGKSFLVKQRESYTMIEYKQIT